MGKTVHRLSEIDASARTATCSFCGPVRVGLSGNTRADGTPGVRCRNAINAAKRANPHFRGPRTRHRRFVGASCARCGFEPEHSVQLDVHHVDEDHDNNDPSNLRTLCANCHRLVHHELRESRRSGG